MLEGLVNGGFCYAMPQKVRELFGDYGAAEKIALALAATFLLQKMQLFLGFDARGDHTML
jgi:hypothetical protein